MRQWNAVMAREKNQIRHVIRRGKRNTLEEEEEEEEGDGGRNEERALKL